jgi:hypothetical protein
MPGNILEPAQQQQQWACPVTTTIIVVKEGEAGVKTKQNQDKNQNCLT